LSPAIWRVVVHRERKPTACTRWKAAVQDARRRAFRTPPGSETRAWSHRGSLERWESQWFPCRESGVGVPTIEGKTPGAGRRLSPLRRALHVPGAQSKTSDTRYRGSRGRTARPREGLLAVFADHSPDGREPAVPGREGGEPMSQGPTGGKAKPGITFFWKDLWEILQDHQPYP
jgi:hypothetical protein